MIKKNLASRKGLILPTFPDLRPSLSRRIWPYVRGLSCRSTVRRGQEQPFPSCGSGSRLYLTEIAGSKAVVVRTVLSPVWDVKKLPFWPNLPDLRPSWSRIALSLMLDVKKASVWTKLPDRRPSWSITALPPAWNVKKILVRPKLPDLNRKYNLRFFTGAYLDAHPKTFKYITMNESLLIKMYCFYVMAIATSQITLT